MKNIILLFALFLVLGIVYPRITQCQPQLITCLTDSIRFPRNPWQIKYDTNSLSPSYLKKYAREGYLIFLDYDIFNITNSDTSLVLEWSNIDSSHVAMRNSFDSLNQTFGDFVFRNIKNSDTLAINTYWLDFDDYVCIDSVRTFLSFISGLDGVYDYTFHPYAMATLPNDSALIPMIEWQDVVWDNSQTNNFWPAHFHKLGWHWNHYQQKNPMAWEITMGLDIVINVSDNWENADTYTEGHPDVHPNFLTIDKANKGDGQSWNNVLGFGHGLSVMSCALAKGNNDADGEQLGMIGSCPECKGVNFLYWNVFRVDVDGVKDNVLTLPSIVNASWGYNASDDVENLRVETERLLNRGMVVIAAAGNDRVDWKQVDLDIWRAKHEIAFPWGLYRTEVNGDNEDVWLFYNKPVYPAAYTFADKNDDDNPGKDVKVIAVGAVVDGPESICSESYEGRSLEVYHPGDEQFHPKFTFGPGKNKFSNESNSQVRVYDKELAYIDIVVPTGRIAAVDERPIEDCQSLFPTNSAEDIKNRNLCESKNQLAREKYHPNNQGTSQAAPSLTGTVGLMLSVNSKMGTAGRDVQRRVYDVITFTADKIADWQNFSSLEQDAPWPAGVSGEVDWSLAPRKIRYASTNPTLTGPLADGEAIQYDYVEQENDPLHRWWAQRVGFGRLNAYRAVAHSIPLKGNRVWNTSQTLFNGITSPPTNENGIQLMHFGAYNDNNDLVLEHGGEDLPGEDYNNQGITWIDGTGTVLTVPTNSTLAIDGLVKTHNPTGDNRIITAGTGKVLITGYLEDVEVVGNVRVDDLVIKGSVSGATGCVAIGDEEITAEVYGKVRLEDYGAFNVNLGTLLMQPGSVIDMQGENDLEIKDGAILEMAHASAITGTSGRRLIVAAGSTLRVKAGAHVDMLTNVLVESGASLIIESNAVVSIDHFTVERDGELIVKEGARVSLNDRTENLVSGRLHVLGTSSKRTTISGRAEDCCTRICTTIVDRASIRVEDDMSNPSDRSSCNVKLICADFSNVPLRTINVPLYQILSCNFSAKRSLFDDASQKVLFDVQLTDPSLVGSPAALPNNFPMREAARFLGCDFFDEDGEMSGDRGTFSYSFTGVRFHQMKRATVLAGDFNYLHRGVEVFRSDSVSVQGAEFKAGEWGVIDDGSILRICSNTFKEFEFGNMLVGSKSSWIFANTYKQSATSFQGWESFASHYVRGNTFEDFRDAGIFLSHTSARLDIASLGRGIPVYYLWGRNLFFYSGNGTVFGAGQNADIRMRNSFANATLPCGYNQFAELTTYHLYSDVPKINYPVRYNEFLDPVAGHAVRTFNVTPLGTPINTSATLSGCSPATGSYCTVSPPAAHAGAVDPYYISDGGWADIDYDDSYLSEAFWNSRKEMLIDTIPTETRLVKMQNTLEAAILGDSIPVHFGILITDYGTMATDTLNPAPLRSSAWFLKGEVQERLGLDSLAGLSYKQVTINYADEADSIPAAWRLQAIDAAKQDPSYGADYDSLMNAWRLRVLEDVRRISAMPSASPKPVVQIPAYGAEPVAGESRELGALAELGQNNPNPFSEQTTIHYRTTREMKVRLAVTNSQGEEVAVLVDGVVDAGEHEALFSAAALPAGIYFYHLEVGGSRQMGAMSVRK